MSDVVPFALTRERVYAESKLQREVVNFLRWALPPDAEFFSIPNTGFASRKVTGRLIGEGLRAGVPDLEVVHQGRALFFELKSERGTLSTDQRQMHRRLLDAGAEVYLSRSSRHVEAMLLEAGVRLRGRLG